MAAADWSDLAGAASTSAIRRGVTGGLRLPAGNGSGYCFCLKSYAAGTFAMRRADGPSATGGILSAALQRTGAEAFLFASAQAANVAADAYKLGLDAAGFIVLAKGPIEDGLASGVIAKSASAIAAGRWVQLRLEVVQESNGDVLINCASSDAEVVSVAAPAFAAVPGLRGAGAMPVGAALSAVVLDDVAAINTGSLPLLGGDAGLAFAASAPGQIGALAQVTLARQV